MINIEDRQKDPTYMQLESLRRKTKHWNRANI